MAAYPDFVNTCGYGSVTGIGGANCRHSFWPFIEGVSERSYSDEELANIDPPPVTFEGRTYTAYEATQMQRRLERTIRRQKRRKAALEAAGLTEDAQAANIRLRRLNQTYKQFSRAAGLPEQRERMRVYAPLNSLKSSGKSNIIKGSGGTESSSGYTLIDGTWKLNPENKTEISKALRDFERSFSSAKKEHSFIITQSGEVFSLSGTSVTVDPSIIGAQKLVGSIGIHNHPVPSGETRGDSFSRADLLFAAKYKTGIEYLVSGERRNAFQFLREFTEEEIYRAWERAFKTVRERAFSGELNIDWEQEEVLKVLSQQLEGFVFYENF